MSDTTEWVEVDDWGTVDEGDTIKAECDGGSLVGVVNEMHSFNASDWYVDLLAHGLSDAQPIWKADGWQLFIPAKPAVELPTEPGIYSDRKGEPWLLHENGYWYRGSYVNGTSTRDETFLKDLAPFTKLEPVPETAKKVLERFAAYWEHGMPADISIEVHEVAKEFGVTND